MSKEPGIKDGESVSDYKKRKKQESKKENTDMSNYKELSGKWNTVKTVTKYVATIVVTLTVVFAGYQLYMQGYNHGANDQKQVNAEVVKQVASLKASK